MAPLADSGAVAVGLGDALVVALAVVVPARRPVLAAGKVVPALTAVATPEALTVATAGALEVQVTKPVIFCVVRDLALPYVPTAVNCAV